ncbi:MAG: hypothetical protein EPN39_12005 [Chitinophagaceae bacterium]|nr:MAG: hypothetical protein EPN39_12005 [Chitinophagaceae bacterium]
MLSHVTWQQYLTGCGGLMVAYYLVILLLFYHKQIIQILSGKKSSPSNLYASTGLQTNLMGAVKETSTDVNDEAPDKPENISSQSLEFSENNPLDAYENEAAISNTFDELEQLSIRLRAIMERYGKKANRTELTEKIRRELAGFSFKVNPESFKEAVNQFIKDQCHLVCGIRIEPADLKLIWGKEMI